MKIEDLIVKKDLKIIYMGTPEFSRVVLEKLLEHYKVRAIVSQPDYNKDRHGNTIFSPVKAFGIDHEILVIQPEDLKNQYNEILELDPDIIITCAYGQIVPKEILDYPKYGCINVHASLLPKYRGGAPIEKAIMNGDKKTGITIMYMNEGMDKGDIIIQESIDIDDDDTNTTLRLKLSKLGGDLLVKTLPSIFNKTNERTVQNEEEATYAFVIKREDERIDFRKTKRQIRNHIRALADKPGAYCFYEGKILKIYSCYITDEYYGNLFNGQITNIYNDGFGIKVSNGEIVVTEVQPEGKCRMNALEFLNGIQNKNEFIGKVLD